MVYMYIPPRYKRPQVYIEEPRRLPVPIVIKRYKGKDTPTTVAVLKTPKRWSVGKKEKNERKSPISEWYKRHKALNEFKNEYTKQKKREKQEKEKEELAMRERDNQWLQQMRVSEETPVKHKKESVVKQKSKRVKARTATARPRADTKYVVAKRNDRYETLSNRFVNCCYRICCQFYCYLSCIFIIGFVIIYFI